MTAATTAKDSRTADARRSRQGPTLRAQRPEKENLGGGGQPALDDRHDDHKWETVRRWLSDVYAARGENVPAYEANQDTLQLLYSLAMRWTRRVAVERSLCDARRHDEQKYREEADHLEQLLGNLGVSANISLSRQGQSALDALSAVAESLGTDEPTLANLESAIQRQTAEQDRFSREERIYLDLAKELSRTLAEVEEGKREILSLCDEIRAHRDESRQELSMWRRNIERLNAKQEDYEARMAGLQNWQQSSAINTGKLKLADVRQVEGVFNSLGDELQAKEAIYRAYLDIPPDFTLAKLKLDEVREKLNKLRRTRDAMLFGVAKHVFG